MPITAISQSVDITVGSTLTAVGTAIAADAKVNVYIVNKTGNTANFRLAISPASPLGGEYLYYDFPLKSSGTFIAADVYVKATDRIWVNCPLGWSARVDGVTLL